MIRLGICDSRFAGIRVQICVFLLTVGVESANLHPDSRKPRVTNPKSVRYMVSRAFLSMTYIYLGGTPNNQTATVATDCDRDPPKIASGKTLLLLR